MAANRSVALATDITIAWLANANTRIVTDDVPGLLAAVHDAILDLDRAEATSERVQEPEIPKLISEKKSLSSPDHIISMIDGKPYRTLTRHLTKHGLTPESYRERFGLSYDYPMVAPSFSAARRALAKRMGLGKRVRGTSG